ncbi:Aste57867_3413 [Aphanomyces stellatus]|uniref:Aste57867_3413 protein n=1 Tax=Aphanomyces stellatus TaxID=120398 RepID=A0A485KE18_9STRA|nr:hypothetical protein As57867_003403 [Aphanomyces stellatus]VFT80579.1 Aste57867_3413 [Aphanomyces stellatus]
MAAESWDFDLGVKYFLGNADDDNGGGIDEETRGEAVDMAAPPSAPRPPRRTRGRIPTHRKQQLELEGLRRELARLKGHVMEIQVNASRKMTYWERVAKMEQLDALKATHENEDLREAVQDHEVFIDDLRSMLRKKRHLMAAPHEMHEMWDAYCQLPPVNDAFRRARAMHAVVDYEYKRLHHVFMRHGLLSTTTDVFRAELNAQPSGDIHFEVVQHATLAAPYRAIGAAAWQVLSTSIPDLPPHVDQTIEPIDECTVYTHMTDKHHDTMCHGHILVKHYAVEGREILIGRSILDDPAHPTPRGDLIEDSTFWYM